MPYPQPTPLSWCPACESYTQDPLAHDCAETLERRGRMVRSGRAHEAKAIRRAAYKTAYDAYCREQARIRAERKAS